MRLQHIILGHFIKSQAAHIILVLWKASAATWLHMTSLTLAFMTRKTFGRNNSSDRLQIPDRGCWRLLDRAKAKAATISCHRKFYKWNLVSSAIRETLGRLKAASSIKYTGTAVHRKHWGPLFICFNAHTYECRNNISPKLKLAYREKRQERAASHPSHNGTTGPYILTA